MTMNVSSMSADSADQGLAAVASLGNCVISVTSSHNNTHTNTNNNTTTTSASVSGASATNSDKSYHGGGIGRSTSNDVGSVGSNSTKTRFSFYNAQEVQLEEQQLQNSASSSSRLERERYAKVLQEEQVEEEEEEPVATNTNPTTSNINRSAPRKSGTKDNNNNNNNNQGEPTESAAVATKSTTSSGTDHQRFNFCVAEELVLHHVLPSSSSTSTSLPNHSTSATSTTTITNLTKQRTAEVDRRSPHSLLATDNDDDDNTNNKRTPAAVAAIMTDTSTTATTLALTPQQGNSATSTTAAIVGNTPRTNSALKKKQRTGQAAAARFKITRGSSTASTEHTTTTTTTATTTNMDSVEILRSLKDTEQMRYNLMKECDPNNISINSSSNKDHDTTMISKLKRDSDHSSSQDTEEIYQDADTFDSLDGHPPQSSSSSHHLNNNRHELHQQSLEPPLHVSNPSATTTVGPTPQYHHRYRSNILSSSSAAGSSSGGTGGYNPYEDAIREALDLLRKHRPPSPPQGDIVDHDHEHHQQQDDRHLSQQQQQQQRHDSTSPSSSPSSSRRSGGFGSGSGIDMTVVQGAVAGVMPMKTPRDADRIMQSRWESPHDQDEMNARRRERQERMARYTSRLAEIKNGEPVTTMDGGANYDNNNNPTTIQFAVPDTIVEATSSFSSSHPRLSPTLAKMAAMAGIPGSYSSGDMASLDTASSLSASHYNPHPAATTTTTTASSVVSSNASQQDVHRSVERVLLAILERAHSNGRASQAASSPRNTRPLSNGNNPSTTTPDPSWQRGEEKKSSPATQDQTSQGEDPLLRAVGELLSAGSGSVLSGCSSASPYRRSEQSSTHSRATRRSVVEELLAETESFGDNDVVQPQPQLQPPHHRPPQQHIRSNNKSHPGSRSSQSLNEKQTRRPEDVLNCSTGVEAVRSDTDVSAVVVDRELDELVLKTLGKATSSKHKKHQKRRDESSTSDDEEEDDTGETGDYAEDEESRSNSQSHNRPGSYDEEEEDDDDEDPENIYDDEDSQDESEDELDDALEGVLGPLSKKAGGTTGVVLESNYSPTSPDRSAGERSIFDSLSNAMSSLVASAISGDDKQSIPPTQSLTSRNKNRDKYATNMDHDENDSDELDDVDQSSSGRSVDEEASELMRSLCAHLLPFGVDQSSRLLDEVPQWDESNPNEAGYRIIRLTNQQLQRVEHAFEAMVHGLKKNSEQNLIGRSQAEAGGSDIDATFERDLAVAEKALDREEEDRTKAILKALNFVPKKNPEKDLTGSVHGVSESDSDSASEGDRDDDASVDDVITNRADECHPDFPGVHSAGKGEMGDLEYFHLPVIFKSHVTGFEPTKDLFLEPGNVVAGQYLVENELGSAAFSTAYRCVDLNSEGDDTEDGHQEVCLKVIKNTKDFFDQSLDEIKILELLRQTGQCHQNNIIEMKTFFYHREHLIIVTELLRQNLFEFGKFILEHEEEPYFTLPRLGYITRQCLIALRFVHKLGLVHSDVKPENILLGSYSRAQVKLIDFGSSCYLTDRQSSYIQSRSYRAPEVVLGLPYDGKIDVWSLGCVVAEMLTGEVTFQNDSIVSMLSRIEAICGPFPRHMIAQGRQSCRFFTKCGLLFEKVSSGDDGNKTPDGSEDEDDDSEIDGRNAGGVYDIFQPKLTTFSARLGFPADLHDRFVSGVSLSKTEEKQALFVDFVRKLLTIDPDSRPSASEALKHPWMVYAGTLTEEDIKYPSN